MRAVVLLGLFAALCCSAQTSTLRVVSEFTRIDPFGQIVPQDRGKSEPREFLSPGIPRNAYSSLRIVVSLDKPATYTLDIGQNPENAVRATLYKEKFAKQGDQWIPDGLEPVKIPYEGVFPSDDIPGQTTVTFWLDMWVDRNAPVDRIKIEPQLWVSTFSDWFTYPMEARILEAVVPTVPAQWGGACGCDGAVGCCGDGSSAGALLRCEGATGVREPDGSRSHSAERSGTSGCQGRAMGGEAFEGFGRSDDRAVLLVEDRTHIWAGMVFKVTGLSAAGAE